MKLLDRENMKPIEIYFNRKRLWGMLTLMMVVLIFFGIALLFLNEIWLYLVGVLLCLVSPLILQFVIQRLLDVETPALTIDEKGLIEYTNALSVGRIEWGQIRDFTFNRELRSIAILLKNPRYFIRKEQSLMKKAVMWVNWKLDSSPLHINDHLLEVSFDDLVQAIESRQWGGMPFYDFIEHLIDDE